MSENQSATGQNSTTQQPPPSQADTFSAHFLIFVALILTAYYGMAVHGNFGPFYLLVVVSMYLIHRHEIPALGGYGVLAGRIRERREAPSEIADLMRTVEGLRDEVAALRATLDDAAISDRPDE